jgi:RHS repeat-associated protein
VVAVVTRGGKGPGVHYVHVDNLGSVDALTDKKGTLAERRSYDPFGQRRSPIWGQPPPASFSAKTTKGFTGHEEDSELGLVNAKGRIFDPKLGRFLTTDSIVSRPYSGQSWNAYSYVLNNPLRYVDPFGFQEDEDDGSGYSPWRTTIHEIQFPDGTIGYEIIVPPPEEGPDDGSSVAYDVGASAPPADLDTTGSSPEMGSQPTTTPEDWVQNPYVQVEGGFLAGLSLGFVPFAGVGHQLLDAAEVLPDSTPEARRGLAVGQIFGGIVTLAGGLTGKVLGGIATTTGIGAVIGLPAIAVSAGFVVGGVGNIAAGIRGLMTTGSGSGGPQASTPAARGGAELSKEAQRSIRSFERRIAEHESKLAEFKANPTVRPGMEGLPKELIQKQQQTRIEHLEHEIRIFRENIEKIKRGEL